MQRSLSLSALAVVLLFVAGCCHHGGGYHAGYGGGCPGGACGAPVGAAPGYYPQANAGLPQTGFYDSYGQMQATVPAPIPGTVGAPVAFQPAYVYPTTTAAVPMNALPTY